MDSLIWVDLNEEYSNTLKRVSEATTASEEAKWELQKLSELHKQLMAVENADGEQAFRDRELKIKEEQLKDSKKDKLIGYVMTGAGILIPVFASSYWMAKGLKFEETGTFTSRVGNWLSSHLRLFGKH
jgi:hypothetical protein